MSKERIQVMQFTNPTSSNEDDVNDFLEKIGTRVIRVTPIYNTINGVIQYVVTYWC